MLLLRLIIERGQARERATSPRMSPRKYRRRAQLTLYEVEHEWLRLAGVQEQEIVLKAIPFPSNEEFVRKYGIDLRGHAQ